MDFKDSDEEGPPELIDVDSLEEEAAAKSPTEQKLNKVPITIVTGMCFVGCGVLSDKYPGIYNTSTVG